jgi:hypothetical protein
MAFSPMLSSVSPKWPVVSMRSIVVAIFLSFGIHGLFDFCQVRVSIADGV